MNVISATVVPGSREHVAAARAHFRGARQREWVSQMGTAAGLHPNGGDTSSYASYTFHRVQQVVDRLRSAGYEIHQLPLGPRGGVRFVLIDPGGDHEHTPAPAFVDMAMIQRCRVCGVAVSDAGPV